MGGEIGRFITLVPKVLYDCFLIRWLYNFGGLNLILIGWFIKLSVNTFQLLIVIYKKGNNIVYHYWGSTSICWPLSYPFRSLDLRRIRKKLTCVYFDLFCICETLYPKTNTKTTKSIVKVFFNNFVLNTLSLWQASAAATKPQIWTRLDALKFVVKKRIAINWSDLDFKLIFKIVKG